MVNISEPDLASVRSGKIVSSLVVQGSATELIAHVGFRAGPEAVWAVLDDVENYVHTMPRVKVSQILQRHDNGLRMRLVIDTPFPLPNIVSIYESIHTCGGGQWKRQWKQVDKALMPNSGSWTLRSMPGEDGTLAEYRVHIEPRIPIPRRLIHFAHKQVLPELFRCVEKHAA